MVDVISLLLSQVNIPTYFVLGLLLIFFGVLLSAFIPKARVQGLIVFFSGIIIIFAGDLFSNLWHNETFRVVLIFSGAFITALLILFLGVNPKKKNRR